MRILFSEKPDWMPILQQAFAAEGGHTLSFAPLTTERLRDSDLVVPLTVPALLALTPAQRALLRDNPIPIPAADQVRLCDDKARLNRFFSEQGFGAHIPAMGVRDRYPFILKRSQDVWGRHSHILRSPQEAQAFQQQLDDPAYFTQELVRGTVEYTTHLIRRRGQLVAEVTLAMHFPSDLFIKGPEKPVTQRRLSTPHLPLLERMLAALDFEGLCCFNYKERDGVPMVFELNPRFGASLCKPFPAVVARL